ncbi:Outer-membrane lipoprotein carrier protein [Candidatus Entotheonellaceae bacterium PAL068K]
MKLPHGMLPARPQCVIECRWWFWVASVWMLVVPSWSGALGLDTLLDNMQDRYEHTQALTADFVQVSTLTSLNRRQTSAGRVFIEKPHHIRWEYTRPSTQTILYDGTLLRIYTPKRQQMLQSAINAENRQNVALLFLAGVGKIQEMFTVTLLPTNDTSLQLVRLLPRSHQASFTELQITVNTHSYFVETLTIHDTIGNITDIHLSSLQVHRALPPQTFELVLPPQTEILTPADFTGR